MASNTPPRPTGNGSAARFMQWVYDTLISLTNRKTPGELVSHTTRGQFVRRQDSNKTTGSSGDEPVWL